MATVADFLEKLSSDDKFEKDFDDHPKKVMKDFGLDDDQMDLIRNGTAKKIREQVEKDLPGKKIVVFRVKMG